MDSFLYRSTLIWCGPGQVWTSGTGMICRNIRNQHNSFQTRFSYFSFLLLLSFRLFLHQQTKQSSNPHTCVRKHANQTIQAGLCFSLFTILHNHTHTALLCDTRGQQGHCLHHEGPSRSAMDGMGSSNVLALDCTDLQQQGCNSRHPIATKVLDAHARVGKHLQK